MLNNINKFRNRKKYADQIMKLSDKIMENK